ncbi:MAG: hypothetical protein FIA99_17975 [Ruminiclostridium sp.]|nr:hypothetical protein [Ruminiclostridium sp.]
MDDIMVRSRYPRHSIPAKRRSRYGKEKSGLTGLIARQLAICLLIFFVILLVKSIDTPFTNYITGNVQYVLEQDIELDSIFKNVDNALNKLRNGNSTDNGTDNPSDKADSPVDDSSGNLNAGTIKPESSVLSASTGGETDFAGNMTTPVNGVLSSSFGERKDPITKALKMHEGIDIEAANGENIVAALGGTVVDAGSSPTYGNYLRIKHNDGFETVYAHCSAVSVQEGQKVTQGEVVATVGNTGASVGTHLHFEVWKDGKAVNPLEYVSVPLP